MITSSPLYDHFFRRSRTRKAAHGSLNFVSWAQSCRKHHLSACYSYQSFVMRMHRDINFISVSLQSRRNAGGYNLFLLSSIVDGNLHPLSMMIMGHLINASSLTRFGWG